MANNENQEGGRELYVQNNLESSGEHEDNRGDSNGEVYQSPRRNVVPCPHIQSSYAGSSQISARRLEVYQQTTTAHVLPAFDQPQPTDNGPNNARYIETARTQDIPFPSPSSIHSIATERDLGEENAQMLRKANCIKCKNRTRRAVCLNKLQDNGQRCGDISFCEGCYNGSIYCPKCKTKMDKVCLVPVN